MKWRDESFKVGDNVPVKLQPYRQLTMATKNSNKLCPHYFGPFPMIKRIGQVAYKLALPPTTCTHNVFHISLLKPFRGAILDQPMPLPPETFNFHPVLEPQLILQERVLNIQVREIKQVLVWWQDLPRTAGTWEDKEELHQSYPDFNLEDKVEVDKGSIDRNEVRIEWRWSSWNCSRRSVN